MREKGRPEIVKFVRTHRGATIDLMYEDKTLTCIYRKGKITCAASRVARGQRVRERGGARGHGKTETGQTGLRSASWPNKRLQATSNSLRSCLAPAIGDA